MREPFASYVQAMHKLCSEECTTFRRSLQCRSSLRFRSSLSLDSLDTVEIKLWSFDCPTSFCSQIIGVTCSSPHLIASDRRIRPSGWPTFWSRHDDFANSVDRCPRGSRLLRCHCESPPLAKMQYVAFFDVLPICT